MVGIFDPRYNLWHRSRAHLSRVDLSFKDRPECLGQRSLTRCRTPFHPNQFDVLPTRALTMKSASELTWGEISAIRVDGLDG